MKIAIHPEVASMQFYNCINCGRGCRSFMVPLTPQEKESILDQRDWSVELGTSDLFVKHKKAGPAKLGLQKRPNGNCVFLDENNLCLIHKYYGLQAKPIACQLFPFVLTPFDGELKVGLRFDCPGVCQSDGQPLSAHLKVIRRLARQIVPPDGANVEPPNIRPNVKVSAYYFNTVNEALIQIASSNLIDLRDRLIWLYRFMYHMSCIKWSNVQPEELSDLISMFKNGVFKELESLSDQSEPPHHKVRMTLGQIFFLLAHPVELVTQAPSSGISKISARLRDSSTMKHLMKISGPLPKLSPDWPDCTLQQLEHGLDGWPEEVQDFLERYLVCRLGGMNYCGPNFYNYSMYEGLNTLLLGMVTIGWLMRIYAAADQRDEYTLSDAHRAVIAIDGNLGYGDSLNAGPASMRLKYLTEHLESLLDWYCQ